ncbi:MAG: type I-U CRISPR-associated RAMP protein Csb1/Cas7u [Bryobacteraceae bacterium]
MPDPLTFEVLKEAVAGGSAAFRCRTKLGAIGEDGDKVFPSTYAGGVYAVEDRRIDGRIVRCVVLDSVQSQANRMEELLQEAFLPNWREMPTDGDPSDCDLPIVAVHVGRHGWITSLTAPHRIHDAILRDSELNRTRFRDSAIGQAIVAARLHNATAFYRFCPTSLIFGTWDSTAGEGLESAKIPRAVVSEIVGIDITPGVRTASRIDPLGIERMETTFYRRGKSGWTFEESEADKKYKKGKGWTEDINQADKDPSGKPIETKPIIWGTKPSDINHGNVVPNIPRFEQKEVRDNNLGRLTDILESNSLRLRVDLDSADSRLESHTAFDSDRMRIRPGAIKPGGVTMAYALHTWTLSLTQLRRLRFPLDQSKANEAEQRNCAARTVLASLAIYGLALQQEQGYWLRSRCELIPIAAKEGNGAVLQLINADGTTADFQVPTILAAKQLFEKAVHEAESESNASAIHWEKQIIRLTPSPQLKKLVEMSEKRQPTGGEEEEVAVADDAGDQN